jgi:hypothetical protein
MAAGCLLLAAFCWFLDSGFWLGTGVAPQTAGGQWVDVDLDL